MSVNKELYLQQKLGDDRPKEYTTELDIVDVKDLILGNRPAKSVKDKDGRYYTYWCRDNDIEFEEKLRIGNKVGVFVRQTPNPKNNNFPYRNIYPKLF